MTYIPNSPPAAPEELSVYLDQELMRISQVLNRIEDGVYDIQYKPPARFFPGLVVYADGTQWDPGSGEGIYRYSLSGSWVKVG